MIRQIWMFAIAAVALAAVSLVYAAEPSVIATDAGQLSGVTDSLGVTSYKGIPFGAPPVGKLRWQAP